MTTEVSETDVLLAEPTPLVLSSGLGVYVERLRTRQLMKLLKILTHGAGEALGDLLSEGTEGDVAARLLGAVIVAIPDAEDETVEFVRSMVRPVALVDPVRTKADQDANALQWQRLDDEMDNPDLDDLITVLEQVIRVEAPHLAALGKRLAALLTVQQKAEAAKKGSTKRTASSKSIAGSSTQTAS